MNRSELIFKTVWRKNKNFAALLLGCCFVFSINCDRTGTGGWTTYRQNNARSGVTDRGLTVPLSLQWTIQPTHAPKPAWPEPGEEMARTHFDNVFHVTSAKGKAFFGSSVDNKVYAVNTKTGKTEWTFFTEGPVRFVPTIHKNRVYVGSDDGYVYCLKTDNGKLVWKYRAGPSAEKVLGNGRMISLWPVRTSVLVDKGIVYFGAGVFPYEGIYICALDINNGNIVWKNDTIGDRAHELAFGGISPQSYLVASENILYVPSGRAMPAAFDIKSGEFLYYCLPGGKVGGTWALLDEDKLITGVDKSGTPAKVVYDNQTGKKVDDIHAWFPGIDIVVTPDFSYALSENEIFALDRNQFQDVMTKMDTVKAQRRKLNGMLSDVNKRLQETAETGGELEKQREDLSAKISELAQEETRLRGSVKKWHYPIKNMNSLILAGDKLFVGGDESVVALAAQDGNKLWDSSIDGKAYGLAAANGNLFVSTDNGNIYCFNEAVTEGLGTIISGINPAPYQDAEITNIYESAAENILNKTGINKGYCLVLDCGTGQLALELAKRTELKIIGIEKDPGKVKAAKQKLDQAGLYGSRVVVEQWDITSLPDYFANLIVSDELTISGKTPHYSEDIFRVLKPLGGIACLGQPDGVDKKAKSGDLQSLITSLQNSGVKESQLINENGQWLKAIRGGLEGAGSWTEQYGNPQNTASSTDRLVKGPLGILWYGDPGPEKMMDRHSKAASPVSMDGRLFIQGEEVIMAYDAYNGTFLWEREIPGAVRARADVDGGNLKVTKNGLYVAAFDKCYRLDPATGETIGTFKIPAPPAGESRRWGYISFENNILYGSRAQPLKREYFALYKMFVADGRWKNREEISAEFVEGYDILKSKYPVPDKKLMDDFKRSGALWRMMTDYPVWELYKPSKAAVTQNMMVSDMVFAINAETGKLLWKYPGKRIAHITITNGDGKIFFAESDISNSQKSAAVTNRQKLVRVGKYEQSAEGMIDYNDIDARVIVALDAGTGKKQWEKPLDVTGCGGDGMAAAYQDGVLLFFGSSGTHDAWRFQNNSLKWRRLIALSAQKSEVLYSYPLNYNARPVIVGNQVFIEPRACDLHTGEIKKRIHPISGELVEWEYLRPGHTCAVTSASANMLFYRSSSTAMYDFENDRGLTLFGGIRPGCWINMIPANGLLLFPESSSGCTCSFPLRSSVVLKHKKTRSQPWNVFIAGKTTGPAKHFYINFGAPADMKDDDGNLWFGYPNPETDYLQNHYPDYGVKFNLNEQIIQEMGYFSSDFRGKVVNGSQKPWLFTSGCIGLLKCEIPLIDAGNGENSAVYTVTLGFNAPAGDRNGQREFDVLLQGETVVSSLDVVEEAGAPDKAVIKEFKGVNVTDVLLLEFLPKQENPGIKQAPIINFIQVVREG